MTSDAVVGAVLHDVGVIWLSAQKAIERPSSLTTDSFPRREVITENSSSRCTPQVEATDLKVARQRGVSHAQQASVRNNVRVLQIARTRGSDLRVWGARNGNSN